jgi:hypothetical protein
VQTNSRPLTSPNALNRLAVIPPVVVDLSNLVHQHLGAKDERDAVLEAIDLILCGIKFDIHP